MAGIGQFCMAQTGNSPAFWTGLFFYVVSLALLFQALPWSPRGMTATDRPLPLRLEAFLLALIALLAVFFRVYKTNQFPDGVFADRAEVALGGLRILHDHWRPFLEGLDQHVPEVCIYYLAALWIKLFGPSPSVFSYFDATLSILGVLAFYGVFRLWVKAPTALLALFFLAVMRWNFVFGHQIFYQCQTILFMAPALGFLYYALKKNQWPFAALGGLAAALGLYSYQAFKAFPLLILLFMGYEKLKDSAVYKKKEKVWWAFWLALLLGAAPLLNWMVERGEIGRRDVEVSVITEIRQEKTLAPIFRNLKDAVLMFNRRGDINSQSNFESRRMLDDVTGVFFILGLGYALLRIRERPYFSALAGLAVMSLPSLLSINGGHAGRMLGTTPFTALICSLVAWELWVQGRKFFKKKQGLTWVFRGFAACFLALIAFFNFHIYFFEQALNSYCRNDFSWSETFVGRSIAESDNKTEFFLSSRFYDHPTIKFLTYPQWERMHPLEMANLPKPSSFTPGQSFCFWEGEYTTGEIEYLEKCYPGGKVDAYPNLLGEVPLYSYFVPARDLNRLKPGFPKIERGLFGVYRLAPGDRPYLSRWDPVINFTFRELPQASSSLVIHWTGQFFAPAGGTYALRAVTRGDEKARIALDRRTVSDFTASPTLQVLLKPGMYSLTLDFQKGDEPIAGINLLWKRPGQDRYTFMPNEAFGPVQAKTPFP